MNKKVEKQENVAEKQLSPDSAKRRKLLGAIAAGGAAANLLPTKWSKPVVDSVLLPAHAEMSPTAPTSTGTATSSGTATSTSTGTGPGTGTGSGSSSGTGTGTGPGVTLTSFLGTATGFLDGSSVFFFTNSTNVSFSGNSSGNGVFTYAYITGSVSSISTFSGNATASWTVLSNTITSQFVPFIFDTTYIG